MDENYLNYSLNLEEKSSWLVVSPDTVMNSLGLYIQELGDFFVHGSVLTEREGLCSYQLAYTYEGEMHLDFRGGKYTIGAGSAYFIDCRDHYRIEGSGSGHSVFVHFNYDRAAYYYERFYTVNNNCPILHIPAPCFVDTGIKKLLDIFKAGTTAEASLCGVETVISMMTGLLLEASSKHDEERFSECVSKALHYLRDNYSRKITLDDLAHEVHISKFYLSRLFVRAMDVSPNEYLANLRISKAKEFLRQTTHTVAEISEMVGIDNTSYFIRMFLKREAVSPGEYRKKWR